QEHHCQAGPQPLRQHVPAGVVEADGTAVGRHCAPGQDQVEGSGVQVPVRMLSGAEHGGMSPSGAATLPRRELVSAAVITTSTKRPIIPGCPGKLTDFMFSVFPVNSFGSLREGPSTRI